MEKAIRKTSGSQASTASYGRSNMSLESFTDLPEELSISPPSNEVVVNLVKVYFGLLRDSFFDFLHEGLFMTRMQEQILPKSLIYAVRAASARLATSLLS